MGYGYGVWVRVRVRIRARVRVSSCKANTDNTGEKRMDANRAAAKGFPIFVYHHT